MRNSTRIGIQKLLIAAIAILILYTIFLAPWDGDIEQGKTPTEDIGSSMFEDYHRAVLFIAFILFSAMLGGIFLAKDEETRKRIAEKKAESDIKVEGGDPK